MTTIPLAALALCFLFVSSTAGARPVILIDVWDPHNNITMKIEKKKGLSLTDNHVHPSRQEFNATESMLAGLKLRERSQHQDAGKTSLLSYLVKAGIRWIAIAPWTEENGMTTTGQKGNEVVLPSDHAVKINFQKVVAPDVRPNSDAPKVIVSSSHGASLSRGQEIGLTVATFVTATLSVAGSSCIVYLILKKASWGTYNRILLGMSLCDVLNSIWIALQPILIPRDGGRYLARGNAATCSALGCFAQFGLSVAFYNGMLSLFYLLNIRFGMDEVRIAKRVEAFMHAVAILFPFSTAVIGLVMGVYNEMDLGMACWVSGYPPECQNNSDVSCASDTIAWAFGGIPVLVILVFIAISNLMIYCTVRRVSRRGRRHSMNEDAQDKRVQMVATQAFLYVAAFFNTIVWLVIIRTMESLGVERKDEGRWFLLLLLTAIFYPLQGFCNLFVYARPRYLRRREQYPERSRLWALRSALFQEGRRDRRSTTVRPRTARDSVDGARADTSKRPFFRFSLFRRSTNPTETTMHTPLPCESLSDNTSPSAMEEP